jgi:hypothetical protein
MKGSSGSEVMSYKAALMSSINRSKSVSPKLKHTTDTLIRINNLWFSPSFDTRPVGDFTMSIMIHKQSNNQVLDIGYVLFVPIDGPWIPDCELCEFHAFSEIQDPDINRNDLREIITLASIQANKLYYNLYYSEYDRYIDSIISTTGV